MAKVDKLVRFIEYVGPKKEKRYYSALQNEHIDFKENDEFDGRKVAIVDINVASELLRFPEVFREIDLREFTREKNAGGNQGDLLEEKTVKSVVDDPIETAIKSNRKRIDKKAKKR